MSKPSFNAAELFRDLKATLALLPVPVTAAVRKVRREFSRENAGASADVILRLAKLLLDEGDFTERFVAYEIVSHHRGAFAGLDRAQILRLGRGLDSWFSVDCFALYLSGPVWVEGRIMDAEIAKWARSRDLWWRRAALVSTVALSRRGGAPDVRKVVKICAALKADREDMVVKALSWAVRELAKKHPSAARKFIVDHRPHLAARVIREVGNKLTTGRKTPRRRAKSSGESQPDRLRK